MVCTNLLSPIAANFLAPETIWNETKARSKPVHSWNDSVKRFTTYYSTSRHNFFARGGEVLYLQLCNVFAQDQRQVEEFGKSFGFQPEERDLEVLHADLQTGLQLLYGRHDMVLNNLVEFIENVEPDTGRAIAERSLVFRCEWCPADSWREGYLFAVELRRLLHTALDPVEKLELLMEGCTLQVLRSLCAQSVRYLRRETEREEVPTLDSAGLSIRGYLPLRIIRHGTYS